MKTLAREIDRAELLARLDRLRIDTPRRWGRMSAPQMICHLADAFRIALGEYRVRDASRLIDRTIIRVVALYLPARWPADIQTVPEIDQQRGAGTAPAEFGADVVRVKQFIQRMASVHPQQWPSHPIFGRLSRRAWLRWGYLHVDHHLRQFGL